MQISKYYLHLQFEQKTRLSVWNNPLERGKREYSIYNITEVYSRRWMNCGAWEDLRQRSHLCFTLLVFSPLHVAAFKLQSLRAASVSSICSCRGWLVTHTWSAGTSEITGHWSWKTAVFNIPLKHPEALLCCKSHSDYII